MARLTKRENVLKKRVAKTKALKKGKEVNVSRTSSAKFKKIQRNNIEILRKLRSENKGQ
ncbi:MAG TPA: hypothetical protein VMT63_12640 [Bacteroidales bacterium]|nr:hypothetical protein [Bacteroidales bacterium]